MFLSDKQKRFVDYVHKENKKPIDVKDANAMFKMIVLNLFELYITAENRRDKRNTAWLLYTLNDDYKKYIKLWHLIEDKEEYERLLNEKLYINTDSVISMQEARHGDRDDFSFTAEEWQQALSYFGGQCAYCGKSGKLTFDHFYPFSKGGDFMKGNIVPSCVSCNSSKNNKSFIDWYPVQRFYDGQREKRVLKYIEENKQLTLL